MKSKKLLIISIFLILFGLLFTTKVQATNNLNIYSPSALLMDARTGKIIYEKNIDDVRYPASTTKMMTAILALEHCDLNEIATVSYDAIFTVPSGYANANLQLGEELTIEQLLNVLLIPSANDAANVIAEHIAGSISNFANMMNSKAVEIGCTNTHFVNPSGIHDDEHVSSARDLALIAKYAMQNSTFRNLVKKTYYSLPSTNKYETTDRVFKTTNDLLRVNTYDRADNYYYKNAIGIKTGYTTPAKNCIVAGAERDGLEFIVVILGASQTETGLSQRYLDCKTLFDYGFNTYTVKKLYEKNSNFKEIIISNGTKETKNLNLVLEDDLTVLIKQQDYNKELLPNIELREELKAPIFQGDVVGSVSYTVDDVTYKTNLLAGSNVEKASIIGLLFKIVMIILILWIVARIVSLTNRKKKRRRKGNYRL
ncbi:MAG: D-alanyl-D-alanine carboxypeptidase [Clostridia bacterium]|nr:D-alanyl-D-alanine carboxypeptidase [Clostridia bacterium]